MTETKTADLVGDGTNQDPAVGLRAVAALRRLTEQLEDLQVGNARSPPRSAPSTCCWPCSRSTTPRGLGCCAPSGSSPPTSPHRPPRAGRPRRPPCARSGSSWPRCAAAWRRPSARASSTPSHTGPAGWAGTRSVATSRSRDPPRRPSRARSARRSRLVTGTSAPSTCSSVCSPTRTARRGSCWRRPACGPPRRRHAPRCSESSTPLPDSDAVRGVRPVPGLVLGPELGAGVRLGVHPPAVALAPLASRGALGLGQPGVAAAQAEQLRPDEQGRLPVEDDTVVVPADDHLGARDGTRGEELLLDPQPVSYTHL